LVKQRLSNLLPNKWHYKHLNLVRQRPCNLLPNNWHYSRFEFESQTDESTLIYKSFFSVTNVFLHSTKSLFNNTKDDSSMTSVVPQLEEDLMTSVVPRLEEDLCCCHKCLIVLGTISFISLSPNRQMKMT
jgi:hypothetical protein